MSSFLGGNRGASGLALQGNASGGFKNKIPKGYKGAQTQNFSPEQMQLFQSLFSNVDPGSYLSKLASGDQSLFGEIEAPAMRQFQELQGQNASRFSGAGMGARKGSGFQNANNQATSDFAMQLQSRRQDLQRQAIQDLQGFSHDLLGQRPFEQFLLPKQKSFGQELLLGGIQGFGKGLGSLFGG